MPSSTSSSRDRAPEGRWSRTWILALALTAIAVAASEYYWRSVGFRPGVSDSADLWALTRAQVYPRREGDSVLVLLGGSRMHEDVSIPTLENSLPGFRIVQLAIVGSTPWPTLRDLAEDTAFAGPVIVSFTDPGIVGRWGAAQEYVDYYHRGPPVNAALNARIDAAVQERMVGRLAQLSLASLVQLYGQGSDPVANYSVMNSARVRLSDYSRRPHLGRLRSERINTATRSARGWMGVRDLPEQYSDSLVVLAGLVSTIEARGGRVVIAHFPMGREIWNAYDESFPRDEFWDLLEAMLPGHAIHFLDYPALQDFSFPDESHLDQKDVAKFTEALLAILEEKGFF